METLSKSPQRKTWIDMMRGICMIAILLDHTEIYYSGTNIIPYSMYVGSALCCFFFLSGYLFYKEGRDLDAGFFKHKLKSIAKSLVIPYFIFTTLIAVPKAFAHGNAISGGFIDIIEGNASWFVAALILAELMFLLVLWITRGKTLWLIAVAVAVAIFATNFNWAAHPVLWHIDNATIALPMLIVGYLFHKNEKVFNRFNSISYTILLFLFLVIIKVYEYNYNVNTCVYPVVVNNWTIYIVDFFIATLFMVSLTKHLPSVKPIEWTGSHCLVYYFFCGGVPLVIGRVLDKSGILYHGQYYRVIFAFILVYLATTAIAWIVYRFFPWSVGKTSKRKTEQKVG